MKLNESQLAVIAEFCGNYHKVFNRVFNYLSSLPAEKLEQFQVRKWRDEARKVDCYTIVMRGIEKSAKLYKYEFSRNDAMKLHNNRRFSRFHIGRASQYPKEFCGFERFFDSEVVPDNKIGFSVNWIDDEGRKHHVVGLSTSPGLLSNSIALYSLVHKKITNKSAIFDPSGRQETEIYEQFSPGGRIVPTGLGDVDHMTREIQKSLYFVARHIHFSPSVIMLPELGGSAWSEAKNSVIPINSRVVPPPMPGL